MYFHYTWSGGIKKSKNLEFFPKVSLGPHEVTNFSCLPPRLPPPSPTHPIDDAEERSLGGGGCPRCPGGPGGVWQGNAKTLGDVKAEGVWNLGERDAPELSTPPFCIIFREDPENRHEGQEPKQPGKITIHLLGEGQEVGA